jgi:hypothetical protein
MLRQSGWVPPVTRRGRLRIEVREPATVHYIDVARVEAWLDGQVDPKDCVEQNRLRTLLAGAVERAGRSVAVND